MGQAPLVLINQLQVCDIDNKLGAAFRQIYSLKRIHKFFSREATETLIHVFIFSHLDYCNGLLHGLPEYLTAKLQRILNMVFKLPKFSHVTSLRYELHWLPVAYHIEFKLLLYVLKVYWHDWRLKIMPIGPAVAAGEVGTHGKDRS